MSAPARSTGLFARRGSCRLGCLSRDLTAQARDKELDDLPVRRRQFAGLSRRGRGLAPALGALHDVGQLFDRAQVGRGRLVDELGHHQLALGDPAAPPSSLTTTFSSSARATKVARFFEPFGRPFGLPERPF